MMCTILFLLCTVHAGASLQQLLDGFVYAPDNVPDYSTIYWLDYTTTLPVLKNYLYDTLVCNPCMLVYQSYAQGNNKVAFPSLYSSKFNMAAMMCVLMLSMRFGAVFLCNWRVVIFPVGNQSSRSSVVKHFTEIALQIILAAGCAGS